MNKLIKSLPLIAVFFATSALAEGDLSRADPKEIVIEMGTDQGVMYFKPEHIELQTGKAYKIVLRNLDDEKHEFAGPELVGKVFSRKVEVTSLDGKMIAEVKGTVSEIEVGSMRQVEWYIVPIQTGNKIPITCDIDDHNARGMHGTITIK